jgi:coenzyme F420-0:L-glutamate ligase/coenzyme F420-1:gamma-L-glutamate ligase
MAAELSLIALQGLPLVRPDDDLGAMIAAALARQSIAMVDGDVVVVAQKVVSKAENRYVDLADAHPSARALELAAATEKDPRLVEVILSESARVVRHRPGLIIAEHRLGYVMANAGVDQSNIEPAPGARGGDERVLLLPRDPDAAAEALRADLAARSGCKLAVIVNDSFGRAWRRGIVGVALGAAGLPSLLDMRGRADLFGRELKVTQTGFADEIAAAASLLMGQGHEGLPVVLVRGLRWSAPPAPAAALIRAPLEDLFR